MPGSLPLHILCVGLLQDLPSLCEPVPPCPHAKWLCGDTGGWDEPQCWSAPPYSLQGKNIAVIDAVAPLTMFGDAIVREVVFRSGEVLLVQCLIEADSSFSPCVFPPQTGFTIAGCDADSSVTLLGGAMWSEFTAYFAIGWTGEGAGSLRLIEAMVHVPSAVLVGRGSIWLEQGTVSTGVVAISDRGSLIGSGDLQLPKAGVAVNGGHVAPGGAEAGEIVIEGSYNQVGLTDASSGGVLQIDIAGEQAGVDHDRLTVSGATRLSGTLELAFPDFGTGYAPAVGDTIRILSAGTLDPDLPSFDLVVAPQVEGLSIEVLSDFGAGDALGGAGIDVVFVEFDSAVALTTGLELALGEGTPIDAELIQIDGDPEGRPELAVLLENRDSSASVAILGNVQALSGEGGATLVIDGIDLYTIGGSPTDLASGDIDGDGDLDIVIGDGQSQLVRTLLNSGGQLDTEGPVISTAPGQPDGVSVGAIGAFAVEEEVGPVVVSIMALGEVKIFGLVGGGFQLKKTLPGGTAPCADNPQNLLGRLGDSRASKRQDLLVTDVGTNTLLVFFAEPDGSLPDLPTQVLGTGAKPTMIHAADLNGDGLPEVITVNEDGHSASLFINSAGSLLPSAPLALGGRPRSLAIADLDADGDQDIAVVVESDGAQAAAVVRVLRNDSSSPNTVVLVQESDIQPVVDPKTVRLLVGGDLSTPGVVDLLTIATVIDPLPPDHDDLAGSLASGVLPLQRTRRPALSAADLNGDGAVDGNDLGLLLAYWGECPARIDCIGDLDGDAQVDGADLGILLAEWSG